MDTVLSIEKGKVPRAPLRLRLAEIMGLVIVVWALAASQWLLVMAGVLAIFISYAVYRDRTANCTQDKSGATDPGMADNGCERGGD
jgi:hypothetical protein